ncbi:MAG: hypothetical protein AAGJ81_10685 [Verrucomicrobiota bacterium]
MSTRNDESIPDHRGTYGFKPGQQTSGSSLPNGSYLIEKLDTRREFVTEVDGYVYWWPNVSHNGHFASHHLRWIADELDRRNEKWQTFIDDHFSKSKLVD